MLRVTPQGIERGSLWDLAFDEAATSMGFCSSHRELGRRAMHFIADNTVKPHGPDQLLEISEELATQVPPLDEHAKYYFLQGAHQGIRDYMVANNLVNDFNVEYGDRFVPDPAANPEVGVVA